MAVTTLDEPALGYADDARRVLRDGLTWSDPPPRTGRPRPPRPLDDDTAIAWVLAELERTLGRSELLDLALAATHAAGAGADGGDVRGGARRAAARGLGDPHRHDLASGTAGHLLGLLVCQAPATAVSAAARRLRTTARRLSAGTVCWPDAHGRAWTGLAHGTSGVILALAEAAARYPVLATDLVPLIDGGLRWESAWFDPARDTWTGPSDPTGSPAAEPWSGPVGIGLARLRLLDLHDHGLALATPRTSLVADVHAAVRAATSASDPRSDRTPRIPDATARTGARGGSAGRLCVAGR